MRPINLIIFFSLSSMAFGQSIISNNNTAVILTPDGIEIRPDSGYNRTNVALGADALSVNRNTGNTAVGDSALAQNYSGMGNTALGNYTLKNNAAGIFNIAVGSNALRDAKGDRNIAIGAYSLKKSTMGGNTAVGYSTLENNLSGTGNLALGYNALHFNEYGYENIALGTTALFNNNNGGYNIAIGTSSMKNSDHGDNNIAIGERSLFFSHNAKNNIAIGEGALESSSEGRRNIAIGDSAFFSQITHHDNIGIGYKAGSMESGSNRLYIENTEAFTESPLIGGIFNGPNEFESRRVGIGRRISDLESRNEIFQVEGEAYKTSAGGNWATSSDKRLKQNIENLNSQDILQKIISLQGVNYQWKDAAKGKGIQHGFIAQDLREVFPTKVYEDSNGYLSASYGDFDPMLVEAIKALHAKTEQLSQQLLRAMELINSQQKRLDNLTYSSNSSKL